MKFSDLPQNTRIKLSKEAKAEFWHRIDEFGGVKEISENFEYSSSKMYNWKSKDCFLPVELVKKVFGNQASDEVVAIKGKGRSKAIRNPEFPLPEDSELLTRIDLSVTVNSRGTPFYQTDDRGNAERFIELLQDIGEVPYSVYSRELYQVRYPKFLHQILEEISYSENLSALIDEEGQINNGKIILPEQEISINEFNDVLFHRDKKLDLALQRNDQETVQELISGEAKRVREMIE